MDMPSVDFVTEEVTIWVCPRHGHRALHSTDTCPHCPLRGGFSVGRVSRRFVAVDATCVKCQEPTEDYVLCPCCGTVKR